MEKQLDWKWWNKRRNKVDKMEVIDSIIVKMWITMWIVWIKL